MCRSTIGYLLCFALALGASACSDDSVPGTTDGPIVTKDGPKGADGPKVGDGPRADGPKADGPKADGPAKDGPVVTPDTLKPGPCPKALPAPNSTCSDEGRKCEYGDNPVCLAIAECKAGTWLVATPKCAPFDPACPKTRADAADQLCPTKDGYCVYEGLKCSCTNCVLYPVQKCDGPLKWKCDAPNPTPGCPAARPNLGTACAPEGQFCDYGCENNVSRKCQGGGWAQATAPGGCPRSSRALKRDIHYLDKAATDRYADQALKLRLATYRYKDPALVKRTHLGYILEDSPKSISSNMERREVDLYSYTSMTLALAKRQQRQIEALQAQLAQLQRLLRAKRPRRCALPDRLLPISSASGGKL
jgi:hypothetical protein